MASYAAILMIILVGCRGFDARAQAKFDASYGVSVLTIPVARGTVTADLGNNRYKIRETWEGSGLTRLLTTGSAHGSVTGVVRRGKLEPRSYEGLVTFDGPPDPVRMTMQAGNVQSLELVSPPSPGDVVITEAHRRGIVDPLTGAVVPMAANGDLEPACNRTIPVFDGRQRFDLALSFKRLDRTTDDEIYRGPVIVCAIMYRPIAGHHPNSGIVKFLSARNDMEVWFAPLSGAAFLAPYRVSVPTIVGPAIIQASHFSVMRPTVSSSGDIYRSR